MSAPATHAGEPVRRIDTHAAVVLLAGSSAYKIKRAVRFPFLDYATLDKRKAACEAELTVNRPFAPSIYLGTIAITREPDGTLALGGHGRPVEWAVKMRRFDENASLDRLADDGKLDASFADAIARVVVAAHEAAPRVAAGPWLDAVRRFLDQNDAAFRERTDLFPSDEANALGRRSRAVLDRVEPMLRTRGQHGLVRRGHGDLHLGNIALIDGAPVPFDAIEFDPLVAAGDVLYDLAFLLMDLMQRGLKAHANIILNRYLAETRRTEDLDALAALPLFLSLRAAIRAKVTAARLADAPAPDHRVICETAQSYFRLACASIAPPQPMLVAVGGLSGTGKSLLARALAPDVAPAPGAVLLRSDVERKALLGRSESERLPKDAYTPDVTAKVYALLADKARRVIAAGHSAIVDAVFNAPAERAQIAKVAADDVTFRGLFLTADLATRLARVGKRSGDASDADETVVKAQEGYDAGTMDWRSVDASGTPDETLHRARVTLAPTT